MTPYILRRLLQLVPVLFLASIGIWASTKGDTSEERAHAERFGIFVGLWAPTFFILADLLGRSPATSPSLRA